MNDIWDVVVIGGGPAGMMSAGKAAARGLRVLLLEKNHTLGKKLRITGGGRCNITNATFDTRALLSHYESASKFLFSTFAEYSVSNTLDFFHQHNLVTKTEAENRVFPISDKAEDVAKVMEKFLSENKVTVHTNVTVKNIHITDDQVDYLETSAGKIFAKNFILATGGTSRPDTGSTGDGYKWLSTIGHKVITPIPSLVPITLKDTWVSDVAGLSIQNATIAIYQNNSLIKKTTGKILFTHNGLSGPGILNISTTIGDALQDDPVILKINIAPEHSEEEIISILRDSCITHANKKIKNILTEIIPASLIPIVLKLAKIDSDRQCNTITRTERHLLTTTIRGLSVEVGGLLGPEKAVVASGGVELTEIDFRTMKSKLFNNLHIIGDMLNIVRPSGGYSLQLCWTTGYVAGKHCGE